MSDTMHFETKLAAAGETLEKLAQERGLSLNDFSEEETIDLLSTIMGPDGSGGGSTELPAGKTASAQHQAQGTSKVAYPTALAEVMKVAAANGYDLNTASPEELHSAVESMQSIMADPQYGVKQAAFEEKVVEADALGRVMAHSYVDELSKMASAGKDEDEDEKAKAEKKAQLIEAVRAKVAGEMPPQFAKHMKGGKGDEKSDKDEDEDDKDEKEKKASFQKQASLRAAQVLIENGVNPETGAKFASADEAVDAAALNLLAQKGWTA